MLIETFPVGQLGKVIGRFTRFGFDIIQISLKRHDKPLSEAG
jgi:hypothetical protein